MAQDKQLAHHVIGNAVPYVSYTDITSEQPVFVAGSNILTKARQLMERRPGFSDKIETNLTTFNKVSSLWSFAPWGGSRFIWLVNDITATASKIYKMEIGLDPAFVLLYTGTTTDPFFFVNANNHVYFSNGVSATDTRAWNGSGNSRLWGIVKPSAAPSIGTTGGSLNIYTGYYYRVAYGNSSTGHISSASALSACTGIQTSKNIQVTLVASSDTQVDQIHVYRTTDGGSTNATDMREISGSPFTNANQTITDSTADASLSTATCPGTTSNDPPPPLKNFTYYASRIWGSTNNQTWFSAFEELPSNGVFEESWPSGLSGNYYNWDAEITGQAPMQDGVACFTRARIWKVEGDRRDNFRRYKLVERRGAINHRCIIPLGNTIVWLDTANQVWSADQGEIGFDIRTDIQNIVHSTASMAVHIAGQSHWLLLLDGESGKMYCYDLDTGRWMPPWIFNSGTSALYSGETSAGNVQLACALNGTKVYLNNVSNYNDAGTNYTAGFTLNLLPTHAQGNPDLCGTVDFIALETDAHTAASVNLLVDDDPQMTGGQSVTSNAKDPTLRTQGTNLVRKQYMCMPQTSTGQRASISASWAAAESNFKLYTIELAYHLFRN